LEPSLLLGKTYLGLWHANKRGEFRDRALTIFKKLHATSADQDQAALAIAVVCYQEGLPKQGRSWAHRIDDSLLRMPNRMTLLSGQGRFDEARALLEVVNEERSGLTKEDLGVAWYEIGYLSYVRDEYDKAARAMRKSVQLAEEGEDPVGAAISRTIELWALYFDQPSQSKLEEMIEEGRKNLALFTARQQTDPRAFRWIMNALAHLVNASYLMGDAPRLVEHLRELRANPWIREFESPSWLLRYEARYAMTQGDYWKAVSEWEKFFQEKRIERTTEGGAWPVLDFGISLARAGRQLRAAAVFRRGLKLEREGVNNAHWQGRIREELKRLPLGIRFLSFFSRGDELFTS
jgi:hypothetical protein